MIGLTSPMLREQQNPAASIGAAGRAMLLFLYAGIALAPPVPVSVGVPSTFSRSLTFATWNAETSTAHTWNGEVRTFASYQAPFTAKSWNVEISTGKTWNGEVLTKKTWTGS
jgi:hypothetical protein